MLRVLPPSVRDATGGLSFATGNARCPDGGGRDATGMCVALPSERAMLLRWAQCPRKCALLYWDGRCRQNALRSARMHAKHRVCTPRRLVCSFVTVQ